MRGRKRSQQQTAPKVSFNEMTTLPSFSIPASLKVNHRTSATRGSSLFRFPVAQPVNCAAAQKQLECFLRILLKGRGQVLYPTVIKPRALSKKRNSSRYLTFHLRFNLEQRYEPRGNALFAGDSRKSTDGERPRRVP